MAASEASRSKSSVKSMARSDEITDYDDALAAVDREAAATLAAAVLLMIFFWGAIFLFEDDPRALWGFPLWFWTAVIGGYVLSVAAAAILVKRFFRTFSLELRPDDEPNAPDELNEPDNSDKSDKSVSGGRAC